MTCYKVKFIFLYVALKSILVLCLWSDPTYSVGERIKNCGNVSEYSLKSIWNKSYLIQNALWCRNLSEFFRLALMRSTSWYVEGFLLSENGVYLMELRNCLLCFLFLFKDC